MQFFTELTMRDHRGTQHYHFKTDTIRQSLYLIYNKLGYALNEGVASFYVNDTFAKEMVIDAKEFEY